MTDQNGVNIQNDLIVKSLNGLILHPVSFQGIGRGDKGLQLPASLFHRSVLCNLEDRSQEKNIFHSFALCQVWCLVLHKHFLIDSFNSLLGRNYYLYFKGGEIEIQ